MNSKKMRPRDRVGTRGLLKGEAMQSPTEVGRTDSALVFREFVLCAESDIRKSPPGCGAKNEPHEVCGFVSEARRFVPRPVLLGLEEYELS